ERRIEQEFGRAQASGMVLTRGDSLDEALATAERVAERLTEVKSRGDVRSFSSITAFLPSREAAERRLRRFASLPRARAAADLRAALEREGFDPAAFGEFFADWLEATPAPVDPGNAALAPLREQHLRQREADVLAATYFEPSPGVSLEAVAGRLRAGIGEAGTIVTGQEIVEREFGRLLALELRWFLACALILNLALLYAAERRLGAALAQLAPTLVALAVTLGIVGFAGIGIGPVNVIVLPLILGLGVDGTVYMNAHIRHAERPAEGAARGLGPLLLAVGTTIVGFGSLAFSRYPALAGLGTLSALGLGISTLTTLLLVPALTPGRKPAESPP
ncbi:MAG: MMPL family transporter, partial [Candidatus Binatia bacterium]